MKDALEVPGGSHKVGVTGQEVPVCLSVHVVPLACSRCVECQPDPGVRESEGRKNEKKKNTKKDNEIKNIDKNVETHLADGCKTEIKVTEKPEEEGRTRCEGAGPARTTCS